MEQIHIHLSQATAEESRLKPNASLPQGDSSYETAKSPIKELTEVMRFQQLVFFLFVPDSNLSIWSGACNFWG